MDTRLKANAAAPEEQVQEQTKLANKINAVKKINTISKNPISDENISVNNALNILEFCKEVIPYISRVGH